MLEEEVAMWIDKVEDLSVEINALVDEIEVPSGAFWDATSAIKFSKYQDIFNKRLIAIGFVNKCFEKIANNSIKIDKRMSSLYYARAMHIMSLLEEENCIEMAKSSSGLQQVNTSRGFVVFSKEETVHILQCIREKETDPSISDFALLQRVKLDFKQVIALNPDLRNTCLRIIDPHPLGKPNMIRYEDANGLHEISDQRHKPPGEFGLCCSIS